MGRGNIFYITKDKNKDVSFNETNYYDKLETYRIDCVDNQNEEESQIPLNCLRKQLYELGATVDIPSGPGDANRDFYFSFSFDRIERAQQDYFRPKLEHLKKTVSELSLFQVIRSAPVLDFMLDDQYGDLFTFNDGMYESTISFDDFIRRMEPGVTYYVYKRVIYMH